MDDIKKIDASTPVITPPEQAEHTEHADDKKEPNEYEQALEITKQRIESFLENPNYRRRHVEAKPVESEVKETPPTEKVETQPTVTPVAEEKKEPAVDVKQLEEGISQRVTENLIKQLTGNSQKQLEVNEKELAPWDKEQRLPKDTNEIVEWVAGLVDKRGQERLTQEQAKQQEETKARYEQEQKILNDYQSFWDNQITLLQNNGKLGKEPEVMNNFWEQLKNVNTKRASEGKELYTSLTDFYLADYKPMVKKQPAGADAPIAGKNAHASQSPDNTKLNYNKIHRARNLYEAMQ